jgi:hypothetical protein
MSTENLIGMHRLNPTHNVDDDVFMGFFPPTDEYYTELLKDKTFEIFLMSDGTTKEGQDRIADFYQVTQMWEKMEKSECNHERYFQLLMLVKTDSLADYLWVSFVEGLHRHAATIVALLCTKFDYENKILPGSLSIQDFKDAKIPHFVDPKISPKEQMKKIMNGDETSKMLQNPFTVEVYIPKRRHGDISQLMDSMRKQSEWISESKTRAANKTISTLLSIWLVDTLSHSKPEKRNDCNLRPTLTHTFTYQSPTSTEADAKHSHINDEVLYKYPHFLRCDRWNSFIRDPFNKSDREGFIEFISPERTKGRTKKIKPPYSIYWQSLTTDVGPVEKKSRIIDVRHVNGYLIIPGIVYLLSTKLQKAVLNDRLGDKLEMNLIHYITRFGYGMRRGPHVTLHGAYSRYTSLNDTKYIQGCFDNINRIIPVTIFTVMLYNACFTYQKDKSTNLLISALEKFDYVASIDDDTFMSVFSELQRSCISSIRIITLCHFFPIWNYLIQFLFYYILH